MPLVPAPALRPTRSGPRGARAFVRGAVLALVLGASGLADAQQTVVHEFIPEDPGEDLSLNAMTLDGDLPAAIDTPSGIATAPDPRAPPRDDRVYRNDPASDTYEPDRDTRRPNVERYDDPFSPATAPFKRLTAYDAVDAGYVLKVADKTLRTVSVGGAVQAGDESFYGDLSVELVADTPVRIPTVGPGVRLLRLNVNPPVKVEILSDSADNWFVRAKERKHVRLVMQLAIPRSTFGSEFAPTAEWAELARHVSPPPPVQAAAFQEVSRTIGVDKSMKPVEVVRKLVEYYRAFLPSEEPPKGRGDLFLDIALSKKGVCRHRAHAFLVTALHMGVPARMVTNEAHAWVEVYDGKLWHRVDLGGAAANLDDDTRGDRPPYVPPPDPYAWPEQRDSAQDLVDRMRRDRQSGSGGNGSGSGGGGGNGSAPDPSNSALAPPPPRDDVPASEVYVTAIDKDIRRGKPVHVQGEVKARGAACPNVRVDLVLKGEAFPNGASIGSLSTDDKGKFDGSVVVPVDFSLGDYDLLVSTPGGLSCGPSSSAK